jgi:NAD(P)H-hydrate epimerase
MTSDYAVNNPDLWRDQLPVPQPAGHKYDRGHLLVSGGPVMTGAARLAARAAQRMGAGLVTLGVPDKAQKIYAAALESIIVQPVHDLEAWHKLVQDERKTGYLLGPGMGVDPHADERVWLALEQGKPTVLDADALNAFVPMLDVLLEHTHEQTVLTPHEGEFKRLFGQVIDEQADRISQAKRAAELAGCTIVLKGYETIIAAPNGHSVVNRNAPPWLATAGAGDVLAGMIAGLIVQKMPVFEAAMAAVWLHGAIAANFGLGLIAEDLVAGIPAALQGLANEKFDLGGFSA